MAVVTPSDRPNSVRNRCVIEVFGGVFVLSHCFIDFSVSVGAFFHRTGSDLYFFRSFFSYISQLVRFARCCTSVSDFNSKNLQITSKLLTPSYRDHKLWKSFGKFVGSYSDLLSKFGKLSFQEFVSEGISYPVFCGDLVYKLWRVKCEANFSLRVMK